MSRNDEPLECLNGPEDCKGPVEYRWAGYGDKHWPRCEKHGAERVEREQEARERYPDGPCIPAGFDPAYAGESWDEEPEVGGAW